MRQRSVHTLVVGLSAVVAASCGTRVQAPEASEGSRPARAASAPQTDSAPSGAEENPEPGAPLGGSASKPTVAAGTTVATGVAGGAAEARKSAPRGNADTAAESKTEAAKTPKATAPIPAPGPGPSPVPSPSSDPKKPIVIASIGTYSGPPGAVLKPFVEGVQVWVKWINDRGGINGHSVKYLWADDGMDPARNRALYQDMVETKSVIAFIANADPFAGAAGVDYVTKKRVPVVGGIGALDWAYESPMYFPYAPEGVMNWSTVITGGAEHAVPKGLKKFGSLTCAEATTCSAGDKMWHEGGRAREVGFEPVYRAQVSIAQPDFTAECLAARRAGAEVLGILMDIASVHRIAASCARQSYKPLFVWPYTAHIPSDHKDPNVEGGVMPAGWFPDMKADTPATAEYQAAFQKFLGGERAAGHSGGWAAGKMFERASSRVPDPTTSAGILEGLWTSFNGETLGGLTMPLTFVRERAVPKVTCWTNVVIKGGAYEMPSNGVLKCA